jgi:hypothetical protein
LHDMQLFSLWIIFSMKYVRRIVLAKHMQVRKKKQSMNKNNIIRNALLGTQGTGGQSYRN